MMRRLTACLAATLVALTACTPASPESPVPSSPSTLVVSPEPTPAPTPSSDPTPSPSPSPSPSTPVLPSYPSDLPTGDTERAGIVAGWQEYWRVYEKFAADPLAYEDFTEVSNATEGNETNDLLDFLAGLRKDRRKVMGYQVFRDVSVSEPSGASADATATVTYCADNTNRTLVEIDSGAIVPRAGTNTYRETATLVLGADSVWRVSLIRNEQASC